MSRGVLLLTTAALACAPRGTAPGPAQKLVVKPDWRAVTTFLDSAVAGGAAPGAVLGVSIGGARFFHTTGQLGADDGSPVEASSVYDLASLTKVIGLTTALMLAVEERKLDLDAAIQRYVPAFSGDSKKAVTVRMLLAHASGLPAWRPLFRETQGRAEAIDLAVTTPLEAEPGARETYSDLGLIVLTQAVETIYHERLDSLLERRVFRSLGMHSLGYLPAEDLPRIAPTELDRWRGRVLRGEVHDENAARMDGVSGHAGLFGSAPDLLTFAEWVLDGWTGEPEGRRTGGSIGSSDRPSVSPSVLREFTRRQELVPGSSRALGWDTPTPGGSAGDLLSPDSFGHTGFTGTSLWIDPKQQLAIVLLSNRVNPTRDNPRWNPVRGRIADLVMTTLFEDAR